MKTKQKTFVALLATLAIGTASVAGLALGANANHGFVANADTSITAVADSDIKLGTNSVTLNAGEEKTFTLDVANVGTYGFTWVSGAATFNFNGISKAPEEDDEPIESDPDEGDPYEERNTHGLNENIKSFYVIVETPETATVTVTAEEATEIVFEVSHLVDTGVNQFTLKAGASQTVAINSIPAGEYKIELKAGSGTVSFSGVGSYVLDAEHTSYTLELASPATTEVTVVSETDVTLEFILSYNEVAEQLSVGDNSVTLKAGAPVYAIIKGGSGYYTFTRTSGTAYLTLNNGGNEETILFNLSNKTYTVYLASPSNTILTLSSTTNSVFNFNLSYSETDPNAQGNTLKVGEQEVQASGWGENYTFTSAEGGTYSITSDSLNAFIMVEGEYGAEWVELPYTFTLGAGETVTFVMSTDNFADDVYTVVIEKLA